MGGMGAIGGIGGGAAGGGAPGEARAGSAARCRFFEWRWEGGFGVGYWTKEAFLGFRGGGRATYW
jgi:hypothetical protein